MRAVVQRVKKAGVEIEGQKVSEIGPGFLVLLGVKKDDTEKEAKLLAQKIANLRIMSDDQAKMNLSPLDVKGEVLVVSQFTLYADGKKGHRPSFISAAKPESAQHLYSEFVKELKEKGLNVKTGQFGAMMDVSLVNDGPVTIILDTEELRG